MQLGYHHGMQQQQRQQYHQHQQRSHYQQQQQQQKQQKQQLDDLKTQLETEMEKDPNMSSVDLSPCELDTIGRIHGTIFNTLNPAHGETAVRHDWLRLMSVQADPRGRDSNPCLVDIQLLHNIHKYKEKITNLLQKNTLLFLSLSKVLNPYEGLSSTRLVGPSAVVMGNIDSHVHAVSEYTAKDVFRFVDLESTSGGFSEYILWKVSKSQQLTDVRGWYLKSNAAASGVSEHMLPECKATERLSEFGQLVGKDVILDRANIDAFVKHVKSENTQSQGVDLVVAEKDDLDTTDLDLFFEKRQHAFTIAQAIVALRLLRLGGTFVFKIYEISMPLSAELLFLIHSLFKRMSIVRSLASRPTSAERFVVCSEMVGDPSWLINHLSSALHSIMHGSMKLSHLVSWTNLSKNVNFLKFIWNFNEGIAKTQADAFQAMEGFIEAQGPRIKDSVTGKDLTCLQKSVAYACLERWGMVDLVCDD
ncbi:hypothetical protein GGI07_002478 [Coemansia sp. Benny D115]|nr:hypothetical protein GGI07_002478 [Coemansia sp. Benny D115]